jgi:ABC-type multidrug transport system permease subunit
MNSSQPIYDASKLGYGKMAILGVQHLFAMFGATILVPILVNSYFHGEGLSIQVTLFFAGIGTLLFHFLSKWKVPAFLGSSFAFLGGTFVPLDILGDKVAAIGRFTPNYWCSTALTKIWNEGAGLSDVIGSFGLELLFGVACLSIGLGFTRFFGEKESA